MQYEGRKGESGVFSWRCGARPWRRQIGRVLRRPSTIYSMPGDFSSWRCAQRARRSSSRRTRVVAHGGFFGPGDAVQSYCVIGAARQGARGATRAEDICRSIQATIPDLKLLSDSRCFLVHVLARVESMTAIATLDAVEAHQAQSYGRLLCAPLTS